jgi:hypothetical protein
MPVRRTVKNAPIFLLIANPNEYIRRWYIRHADLVERRIREWKNSETKRDEFLDKEIRRIEHYRLCSYQPERMAEAPLKIEQDYLRLEAYLERLPPMFFLKLRLLKTQYVPFIQKTREARKRQLFAKAGLPAPN